MSIFDNTTETPLDEVYIYWIERTIRRLKQYKQREFAAFKSITSDQWVVLKRIYENQGITQKEVAQSTFKDPASVTRILDLLAKKDYITRSVGKSDRRAFELYLTTAGEQLVRQMLPIGVEIRNQGLKGLTKEDLAHLRRILDKIYDNFE